jgi:hypothetical protein
VTYSEWVSRGAFLREEPEMLPTIEEMTGWIGKENLGQWRVVEVTRTTPTAPGVAFGNRNGFWYVLEAPNNLLGKSS